INHFFFQVVCTVLPQFLIKLILYFRHCTTLVSIMVGPPTMSSPGEELSITDMITFVPHSNHI
ncbi:hypothetical protein ILUMI_14046, partial [Ignelater luminosus]